MATRYVDMTPTWEQTVRMCLVLMANGNSDGRAAAEQELLRMGRILDQKNRAQKSAPDGSGENG